MFTNDSVVAASFYFLRNDEKRVAELRFENDCFKLVNERVVSGYVNAEFIELEKAIKKIVKQDIDKQIDAIYDNVASTVSASSDKLQALNDNAIQLIPSASLFLNEVGEYRLQVSESMKLIDLTKVFNFDSVANAVVAYDNGAISGKELQTRVCSWYEKNGFTVEMSGKRVYNLKHCVSVSLNVKKRKISSTVKTAMIAYIAICDTSVF